MSEPLPEKNIQQMNPGAEYVIKALQEEIGMLREEIVNVRNGMTYFRACFLQKSDEVNALTQALEEAATVETEKKNKD